MLGKPMANKYFPQSSSFACLSSSGSPMDGCTNSVCHHSLLTRKISLRRCCRRHCLQSSQADTASLRPSESDRCSPMRVRRPKIRWGLEGFRNLSLQLVYSFSGFPEVFLQYDHLGFFSTQRSPIRHHFHAMILLRLGYFPF